MELYKTRAHDSTKQSPPHQQSTCSTTNQPAVCSFEVALSTTAWFLVSRLTKENKKWIEGPSLDPQTHGRCGRPPDKQGVVAQQKAL